MAPLPLGGGWEPGEKAFRAHPVGSRNQAAELMLTPVVAHPCKLSSQEAEPGASLSLRLV